MAARELRGWLSGAAMSTHAGRVPGRRGVFMSAAVLGAVVATVGVVWILGTVSNPGGLTVPRVQRVLQPPA